MTATIGRTVHYRRRELGEVVVRPAVVLGEQDGGLRLWVLDRNGGFYAEGVLEGDGPGTWSWPQRVPAPTSAPMVDEEARVALGILASRVDALEGEQPEPAPEPEPDPE